MTEIKCRAWDSKEKIMIPSNKLGFCVHGGKIEKVTVGDFGHSFVVGACNVTLLWYTGEDDRNGTEIYEGDIVYDFNSDFSGIVSYRVSQLGYVMEIGREDADLFGDLEVVGNIYEHPDSME